ncbi:response regulator [Clostridium pasteurianum]|uniref:response regulator n=1 Tax=Clostridium pasteurianum TaxID=1501 RepID=UPI00241868D8|nr:response regulator transcription factor [Clostridium pasteurianum]
MEENLNVVGTAENGEEVIKLCREKLPDLVLMDIRMPKMDGVKCTKILKSLYPEIIVLVLTTFNDIDYIVEALNYGAAGYILKDIEGDELIKAINEAYKGSIMLPASVARKLAEKLSNNTVNSVIKTKENINNDFSQREVEIARMLAMSFNNKQIASSLFISEGTVKNYISNIYSKIGTSDRMSAALEIKRILKM